MHQGHISRTRYRRSGAARAVQSKSGLLPRRPPFSIGRPSILAYPPVALPALGSFIVGIFGDTPVGRPPVRACPLVFVRCHMLPPHPKENRCDPKRSNSHNGQKGKFCGKSAIRVIPRRSINSDKSAAATGRDSTHQLPTISSTVSASIIIACTIARVNGIAACNAEQPARERRTIKRREDEQRPQPARHQRTDRGGGGGDEEEGRQVGADRVGGRSLDHDAERLGIAGGIEQPRAPTIAKNSAHSRTAPRKTQLTIILLPMLPPSCGIGEEISIYSGLKIRAAKVSSIHPPPSTRVLSPAS